MRILRKLYVLTFIICIFICKLDVYAFDKETVKAGKGDSKNVYHWHQSNSSDGTPSVPKEAWSFEVYSGRTLGAMGCSYFSTSYMLVKMGEESPADGFTPVEFAKSFKKKKLYTADRQYVDFNNIEKLYPNVKCEDHKTDLSGKSKDEQQAYIKGKLSEGYFAIACVTVVGGTNGHYIFIDGFDENGDMIIGDSAYPGNKWSDYYGTKDTTIAHVTIFSNKEKKSTDCPSIYDDVVLKGGMSSKEKKLYEGIVSEFELNGMPEYPSYLEQQDPIYYEDRDGLTQMELRNVEDIKCNIESRKYSLSDILGILVSLVGLVLCVYAILLYLSGIFDMSNNWLDFSAVELLTRGKCKVVHEYDIDNNLENKGKFTMSQWTIRCIIILIIGVLLVSGLLQKIIYAIIFKITGKFI